MKFCKVSAQKEPVSSCYDTQIQDENQQPLHSNLPTLSLFKSQPIVQTQSTPLTTQEQCYRKQILQHLIKLSQKSRLSYNYFASQPDISQHMRSVLLNWLIEVHLKYKLQAETYFLIVNIIDTFLERQAIPRTQLQLVGITALWIAAKYNQTYQVPKISNLIVTCDSAYSQANILEMEGKMIGTIGFQFLKVSPLTYFETINHYTKLTNKDYFLARYLLEAVLFSVDMLQYSACTIAFSMVFFIRKLRGTHYQDQTELQAFFDLHIKEVKSCARDICNLWQRIEFIETMSSLRNKYLNKSHLEVAKIRISEKNR